MEQCRLFIDGIEIKSLEDCDVLVNFGKQYSMVLIDNQIIKNKMLIFKGDRIYCCCDLASDSNIYKKFPKNQLITLNNFDVIKTKGGK